MGEKGVTCCKINPIASWTEDWGLPSAQATRRILRPRAQGWPWAALPSPAFKGVAWRRRTGHGKFKGLFGFLASRENRKLNLTEKFSQHFSFQPPPLHKFIDIVY